MRRSLSPLSEPTACARPRTFRSLIVQLNAQYDVYVEYGIPRLMQRDGLVQSTPFSLTIENSQGWKTPKVEQMGIYPAVRISRKSRSQRGTLHTKP